ncbi:DUF6804 family protein [Protaetiibacter intestinalis]|uniref:Uncharacterized protein n=1 Tax=Protaetiibacter intestinalis TaxID=2419774 RepID=A0A387BAZ4_9MICO|nr:DUF6804 family protein [Protaetiibacter intestinalis]AYF98878.1 hypothetical protein D7I47_11850 [Protaetiibacter intestinalis]
MSSPRPASRYGDPGFRRLALAPGLIAAVVLFVGIALIGDDAFVYISWGVAVLALIVMVFAVQARHWWWLPVFAAVAVLWNPVVPFGFGGPLWLGAQYVAIIAFLAAGVLIKVPLPPGESRR